MNQATNDKIDQLNYEIRKLDIQKKLASYNFSDPEERQEFKKNTDEEIAALKAEIEQLRKGNRRH